MNCKNCDNPLCDTDRKCISPPRYKPCPFCEGKNISMTFCSESYRSFQVECDDCKANGPEVPIDSIKERESGRKKATDAWNKRSVEPMSEADFLKNHVCEMNRAFDGTTCLVCHEQIS